MEIVINPQNMSKGQAEAAMLNGSSIAHISWSPEEKFSYSRSRKVIIDEQGDSLGNLDDQVWKLEQNQQWGWLIVE